MRWCIALAVLPAALSGLLPGGAARGEGLPPAAASPLDRTREPLLLTSQALLQKLRLAYLHQGPARPPAGGVRAGAGLTWANLWSFTEERLRIDGTMWSAEALAEVGLAARVSASLRVPAVLLHGGVSDAAVNRYHDRLVIDDLGREDVPDDELRLEVTEADGSRTVLLDGSDTGWHRRAPVVSLRIGLTGAAAAVPVTAQVSASLPGAEARFAFVERGGHDWAVGVSAAALLAGRLGGTASLAYGRSRSLRLGGLEGLRDESASLLLGLSHPMAGRSALLAQVQAETPPGEGTGTFLDKPVVEGVLGVKWAVTPATVLEFGFWEDLTVKNATADVGLHVGVRSAWE